MPDIINDLRSSIRSLRARPLYATVAVSILALGLAASIAVFTYINGFYQPFPGVDTDRLVQVYGVEEDNPYTAISYPDFLDYRRSAPKAFESLAASQYVLAGSVRHGNTSDQIYGQAVTGNYFSTLGVEMSVGRSFTEADDRPGATPAVILSHAFWRRRFNGDPAVVGSVVHLNGKPITVVGVTSPEFLGAVSGVRPDIWLPLGYTLVAYGDFTLRAQDRNRLVVLVYGKLRAGVNADQAQAELAAVTAGIDQAYPRLGKTRRVQMAKAMWVEPAFRLAEMPTARLMLAGGGVLLLLACANVANLLLSMAGSRRRELALKAALGASPGRLLRQLLGENLLLATVAGAVALLLAGPASARIGAFFAQPGAWRDVPARHIPFDLPVFAFAFGLAALAGLLAGGLPALQASRRNLVTALKAGGDTAHEEPSQHTSRRPSARNLLVSAQVGLSVVLLVVAGLVLRTLDQVANLDPGFKVDSLLSSLVSISSREMSQEERVRFYRDLLDRLNAESWVQTASMSDFAPTGYRRTAELRFDGHDDAISLPYAAVMPGYFEALGLEVLRGRALDASDKEDTPGAAVINEALARRLFTDDDPLGSRLWWPARGGESERSFEIVGVVRSVRGLDLLSEPDPLVYVSYPQSYPQHRFNPGNTLLLTTGIDPVAALPLVERVLRDFDADLAIYNILPYADVVRGSLYSQRMNAELFSVVALLGLALAAAGIFSVMNLAVSRRTREIGIRMAIGARRRDITLLVIGGALIPVGLGLGIGLAATFMVARLVRSMLYGIEASDPLSFIAGTGVLLTAALLAAYLPARRAAAMDPVSSLRSE